MSGVSLGGGVNSSTQTDIPRLLIQTAIPFVLPSSGTIGNNGALSAITALPVIYSGGCFMYFPANAISAGSSAGWYWTIMSSTTAGTIYNNTYTSGNPKTVSPGDATAGTAFVTTGPGAYTQSTTAITALQVTLAGGSLGPNGSFDWESYFSVPSNVNAKTVTFLLNGNQFGGSAITTASTVGYGITRGFINRNSQAKQASFGSSSGSSWPGTALQTYTVDTSANVTLAITLTLGVATDFMVIERAKGVFYYGA